MKEIKLSNGYTIKVFLDESGHLSPREDFDNLGNIEFNSDKFVADNMNFNSTIELLEYLLETQEDSYDNFCNINDLFPDTHADQEYIKYLEKKMEKDYIFHRIYIYEHSDINISVNQSNVRIPLAGYIYVSKGDVRKEYNVNRISKQLKTKVLNCLESEINIYSMYVSGDVWAFEVYDQNDNLNDSCYGFFGSNIEKNGMLDHFDKQYHKEILLQK